MAEKIPRQKWSISYLWEHFLVPEHRIPIWVILRFRFSVADIVEDMEIVNISLYVCINANIDKNSHGGDSLGKSTGPSRIALQNITNC